MKTLLLTNHYEGAALDILKNAVNGDFNLCVLDTADRECLLKAVPGADYLLVSGRLQIDDEVLTKASKLKMIQRTGVGLDNMDLDAVKRHGIPLYVNAGVNAGSVAEYAVMLMLSCLRRSYFVNTQMRKGIWKKQATGLTTYELSGKTVGLVGAGKIGRYVAGLLKAFGVKLLYTDKIRLDDSVETELALEYVPFEELLGRSDIVSLHCSFDKDSGALMGEKEFALMKDGAVFINTARGGLVDGQALLKALDDNKLSSCGLDVFCEEPLPKDHPFLNRDDVLLSPHIAGVSRDAFISMMQGGVENIRCFDENRCDEIEHSRII